MKRSFNSNNVISAPTIDDIDASNTPSLVGYWKCSDYSGNKVITDYSGNGFHLSAKCTPTSTAITSGICNSGDVITSDGYLETRNQTAFTRDVTGTVLANTNSKYVIWGGEMAFTDSVQSGSDSDYGSATQGNHYASGYSSADFSGFQLASVGTIIYSRAIYQDSGQKQIYPEFYSSFALGDEISIASCYVPSTSMSTAYRVTKADGSLVDAFSTDTDTTPPTTATFPASLTSQNNVFGFRCTGPLYSMPLKNYYVWMFDSEPVYMTETIQWLSQNPGKIPPWWIGR